jgi:tetratricopeptide (TPR) repeat protein
VTARCLAASALAVALASVAEGAVVLPECADHREHGRVEEARRCYQAAIRRERDPYVLAEAQWRLGRREEANTFFRTAVAARPRDPAPRLGWGRLFLESHNPAEASKLFEEVLALDAKNAEAHLGLALVAAEDFDEDAVRHAQRALELNPKLTEARVLLARLALEEGDVAAAGAHLDAAERLPGSPLPADALRAALDFLKGEGESPWVDKALAVHPHYGDVYAVAARQLVLRRQYREAADLYARAVEIDPEAWAAHAERGVNLWRLGDERGARRELEIAYAGDPFSPTTVNSLRLLDSLQRFRTVRSPRGILRLHEKEADLLRPYATELLEKAIDTYQAKYRVTLGEPVRLEVYPDHEDFAVRTMGLPGLGALGVTFGTVVAMDSPSGRPPGHFHWGSTLWHELSHVFVLESTRHRSPRWITEGLAMYEEWTAGEGWGDPLTPDVIEAIRADKLLPIAQLDRGFMRPDYPGQVGVSYYQAGVACEMIARQWGFQTLLAMLQEYARERSTAQVLEAALGLTPEAFDARFHEYLAARNGPTVAAFESEWKPLMKTIEALRQKKDLAALVAPARRARDLYPDYVGDGNAYQALADALLAQGDTRGAAAELERYRVARGRDPETLKKLAALEAEAGDKEKARRVLEELIWIWPGDESLHATLGDLWLDAAQPAPARREFEILLALPLTDPVGAHYKLALACHQLGDREHTREHLLLALEQAPGYRPAQKLLLEIHRQ